MRLKRTFSLTSETIEKLKDSMWEQSLVVEGSVMLFLESDFDSQSGIISEAMKRIHKDNVKCVAAAAADGVILDELAAAAQKRR